MKKKLLALLLVLSMVMLLVPTAFAAESDDPTYVSLGASNVNGYGLRGYVAGDMDAAALDYMIKANANVLGYTRETPGSYPTIIANELGYNLEQLAISSMRVEELRILLDNSYNGDSYSNWRFMGRGKWFDVATQLTGGVGGVDELREDYQNKVRDAELITVDIGANNFGVYISYQLTSNYSLDNDLSLIDGTVAAGYQVGKEYVKQLIAEHVPEYADILVGMEDFVDTLAYALVGFCTNFDVVMDKIYELNPDAQVVVISIQNLMDGLIATIPGIEGQVPLGDLFAAITNAANLYIAAGSSHAGRYLCADVRQKGRVEFFLDDLVEYDGNPASLDQNIIDCFDVYDGNPGVSYDSGLHVKYMVYKELYTQLEAQLGSSAAAVAVLEQYLVPVAYDVLASILQGAAKCNTVDLSALEYMDEIEDKLLGAIFNELEAAVMGSVGALLQNNPVAVDSYTLPADFFANVAAEVGVPVSAVEGVASLSVRTVIGNSFFGHPNPDGHAQVAAAVLSSIENGTSGEEIAKKELAILIKDLSYDATHGEYCMNEESYYVALGDAEYAEGLAAELGLEYAQLGLADDYLAEIAKADLVTVKFGNASAVSFVTDQVMGLVADFINDNNEIQKLFMNPVIGNDVKAVVASMVDLTKSYDASKLDWSKYDSEAIAARDKMLTIVKNILVEQGVPEYYDLAPMIRAEVDKITQGLFTLNIESINVPIQDIMLAAAENVLYCYIEFSVEFSAMLNEIRAIAPDAQIVVTGIENRIMESLPALITDNVDLSGYSEYMDYVVDVLNFHLLAYAAINTNTTYVEIGDVENILNALTITVEEPEEENLLGDVNDDGVVDTRDLVRLSKYFAEVEGTVINERNSDVTCDGIVDTRDMVRMSKVFAEVPGVEFG